MPRNIHVNVINGKLQWKEKTTNQVNKNQSECNENVWELRHKILLKQV